MSVLDSVARARNLHAQEPHAQATDAIKPPPPEVEPAPTYPIEALGGILGDVAQAIATGYQLDPAIAGQGVLSVAFLCVQGLADVQTPGGRKPLSDYLLTVALSGDGKSTADGVALAPVRQLEREEFSQYRQDRATWEGAPKQARGDKPVNPLRLVNDFTAEGLVRQYREGRPGLGAFSDEAGAVLGGHPFSIEKKLSTAAALSSLFDGAGIRARARASDDRGGLEAHFDVRLSCHWLIQPAAVHDALHDYILGEQGFWPRVLLAAPAPGMPRKFRPYAPDQDPAVDRYWQRVTHLMNQPYVATDDRDIIATTPEAHRLMGAFFEATEKGARHKGGRLAPIRAWAARATEHVLRVAGALAVFERGERASIGAEEVERAAALVTYSLECWLHLLENKPVDEAREYAQRLLQWLKSQPGGQSNETAMIRLGPKPRSASLRDAALGLLEAQYLVIHLGGRRWAAA
jgi:hypothetical protein